MKEPLADGDLVGRTAGEPMGDRRYVGDPMGDRRIVGDPMGDRLLIGETGADGEWWWWGCCSNGGGCCCCCCGGCVEKVMGEEARPLRRGCSCVD